MGNLVVLALVLSSFGQVLTDKSDATVIENVSWVKESQKFNICCSLELKKTHAVILTVNSTRLRAIIRDKNGAYRNVNANMDDFIDKFPYWSAPNSEGKLCIENVKGAAADRDNGTTFICEAIESEGVGRTTATEIIKIAVFRSPSVKVNATRVIVKAGDDAFVLCEASGQPNLHIAWRSKDTKAVLTESRPVDAGKLLLKLPRVEMEHHDKIYACEATTTYPVTRRPTTAEATLSVQFAPKINVTAGTIYTDLGISEAFEFLVTGYPLPDFSCGDLFLEPRRRLSTVPQGGLYSYRAVLNTVKSADVRTYICTARNDLGTVQREITLTVAPSVPEVVSPNATQQADYYLLSWLAHSRAPLVNVTIDVREVSNPPTELNAGNPQAGSRPIVNQRRVVFRLDDPQAPHTSVSTHGEDASSNTSKWRRQVWHHLVNLSEDTEHRIHLTVCNQHACSSSVSKQRHARDGETPSDVVFKTAKFDGSNKVDPELLKRKPMELAENDEYHDILRPSGNTGLPVVITSFWSVVVMTTLVFQIY